MEDKFKNTHSDYKCECGQAFGDPSNLARHRLAIHPEELREEDPQTSTHRQVDAQDPLYIPSENKSGLGNNCSDELDLQVGPTDANTESQESETTVALHMPEMGAASKTGLFQCPHCLKTYSLKKHLNNHIKARCPDNRHVCPLCDKVWRDSYKLTVHMRSHTGEKLFKSSADGCGKDFARRHNLEVHVQTHHREKMEPKPTCAICGAIFANTEGLRAHNWRYHNPQKKQHPCGTCGKVFNLSWHLRRLLLTHLPDDPQDCPICGTSCRNGVALKEHVRKHGRDVREGNYPCEHCLQNFTTKSLLTAHIRTVHVGQKDTRNKNHVCSFCGWKFSSPCHLAIHLRTHTGETPFKCTSCSKGLATEKSLQNHMKLHTGENLEECQFCGRKFTVPHSLAQHLRTHTGEKPFKCTTCSQGFATKQKRQYHSRIHMGKNPYKCDECGK